MLFIPFCEFELLLHRLFFQLDLITFGFFCSLLVLALNSFNFYFYLLEKLSFEYPFIKDGFTEYVNIILIILFLILNIILLYSYNTEYCIFIILFTEYYTVGRLRFLFFSPAFRMIFQCLFTTFVLMKK